MATNVEPIVLRVVELNTQIKALTAQKAVHSEWLCANVPVGSHVIAGHDVIVKQPEPAWSAKGKRDFVQEHPVAEFPELFRTEIVLDTDAADKVLTDIERDAYLIPAKRNVTVK